MQLHELKYRHSFSTVNTGNMLFSVAPKLKIYTYVPRGRMPDVVWYYSMFQNVSQKFSQNENI